MAPLLSVIFAHKNRERLLRTTLQRWRQQVAIGPGDIELIVADDGSDVLPIQTCRDFNAVLVKSSPNPLRRGPSVAWNVGLNAATGLVLACTHPEIIPDPNVARYLIGACLGDADCIRDVKPWVRDGDIERILTARDVERLSEYAVRANVTVYRLSDDEGCLFAGPRRFSIALRELFSRSEFWDRPTEFGGHSNVNIRYDLRGYFWNNLFAMRSEVWRWMNYFRSSDDWGIDDTDFQERNRHLHLVYAYTDDVFGYHQWHEAQYRGGLIDLANFTDVWTSRLLDRVPKPSMTPELTLKRGDFWG